MFCGVHPHLGANPGLQELRSPPAPYCASDRDRCRPLPPAPPATGPCPKFSFPHKQVVNVLTANVLTANVVVRVNGMVCSANVLPSHCRGRRRHAALSVAALIACIGLVGSGPHHHHRRHPHERQRVDEKGWAPESEDPAFSLSIEDRVSIIFM